MSLCPRLLPWLLTAASLAARRMVRGEIWYRVDHLE